MFLASRRYDPDEPKKEEKRDKKRIKIDRPITETDIDGIEEKKSEIDQENIDNSSTNLQIDQKHQGLLTKFRNYLKNQNPQSSSTKNQHIDNDPAEDIVENTVVESSLIPLPQPKPISKPKTSANKIPSWMSQPIFIPLHSSCDFSQFELSENTLKQLDLLGFKKAFAVQTKVIDQLLKDIHDKTSPDRKKDILVNSFTGSGKTLAYSIPIVEALISRLIPRTRALIIVPTKSLTQQVRGVIQSLTQGTNLKTLVLGSDMSFAQEQRSIASNIPDIVIATPGRLVDHLHNTKEFSLNCLQFLVVDEADRLLNQSFQEWVPVVMNHLPLQPSAPQRPVQKLVFSATSTRDPGKLTSLDITSQCRIFIVGEAEGIEQEFSVPNTLEEKVVLFQDTANKPLVLIQLLESQHIRKNTLIFTKSNESASRLARLMTLILNEVSGDQIRIDRCTGEMDVLARHRTLKEFSKGNIGILVCTDLIARGIDISTIEHVINYDLPIGKREYVHRVGRTARAGASGTAWSLISGKGEKRHFNDMAKTIYRDSRIEEMKIKEMTKNRDIERDERGYEDALKRLEEEVYK